MKLLRKVCAGIKEKRHGLLARCQPLQQDKSPVASGRKRGFEILSHLLYSPDLTPSDYTLFGNMNNTIR
ncbi:hypothetical protein CAPTEDRAFT_144288 [Capitella teleta]|uniref:Uncharacterized protein n=1 Tax=Capitella teleta TaxID=283909 RepID=R7USM8_CAPTE|nr:hypothetical protein CAPTEDRAFT_144288 [Capitella teleta]|eukprot:ELU09133.1 hypothetical protein CAPTEDRAFT_144288 [Capitella teleta]